LGPSPYRGIGPQTRPDVLLRRIENASTHRSRPPPRKTAWTERGSRPVFDRTEHRKELATIVTSHPSSKPTPLILSRRRHASQIGIDRSIPSHPSRRSCNARYRHRKSPTRPSL